MADDQTPDWRANLPEPIQGWDEVKNAKDPDSFWQQMTHMRSRMGRSITIPGQDASADDHKAFYDKVLKNAPNLMPKPDTPEALAALYSSLGRPDAPDAYKAPEFKDVPEGVRINSEKIEGLKALAHKHNLTQAQYEGMVSDFMSGEIAASAEANQKFSEALKTLRSEWGAAADERFAAAEKMRVDFFPFIPEGAMSADTVRAMVKLAAQMGGEGRVVDGPGAVKTTTLDPATAQAQISEILRNKQHAYWNPADPGHKAAKARMRELNTLVAAGPSSAGPQTIGIGGVQFG